MSLRFIYGRAGSGKSFFCCNDIKRRIESGCSSPLIMLVPEDFSFQAEKDLLKIVGEKGLIQARVLSFKRMVYDVFKETGGLTHRHLNSAGRSMLLYGIMNELKHELKVFSKSAKAQGFAHTMSGIITELKNYSVSPEDLALVSEKVDDTSLKGKINDINLIFSRFEDEIKSGYIDPEDDLTKLSERLGKYSIYDGGEIWLDGFSMFTPQQYSVIEKLLRKFDRVNITLCSDCRSTSNGKMDVFSGISRVEEKTLKIAQNNNIAFDKPVNLNAEVCFKFKDNPELHHLERNIYAFPFKTYNQKTIHINLFKALNRYSEVEDTARDITRLCRDLNYRFGDIAVITGDMRGYEKLVPAIFSQYSIPYFVDKRRDITGNPLIVLVLSAMDIILGNWTYESVFRYLKTSLLDVDEEDIDILENYVLSLGIKGRKWTDGNPWEYWPDYGYDGELPEDVKYRLERINKIKDNISAPLISFHDSIKKSKTAREMSGVLFEFIDAINVYERVDELVEDFRKDGEYDKANEYSKVWNMFIDTLDQAVDIFGTREITPEAFFKILSIGFEECKVGLIPPTLDQVMFAGVDRIKSRSFKALYILGINDGVFPAAGLSEGILSDMDRVSLKSLGLELAPGTRDKVFDEQFLVYTALTRADSYLRLSYPAADHEGRTQRPSIIVGRLRKLFVNLSECSNVYELDTDEENLKCISSPMPTFNSLVGSIRKGADGLGVNRIWQDVRQWYLDNSPWKNMLERVMEETIHLNKVESINVEKVKSLYGNDMHLSISRLERYAVCPFSYFIQHGLKARERRVYELSAPDLGSFMHAILDNFSRYLDRTQKSWRDIEREECLSIVSGIVDETVDQDSGSIFKSSARYIYMKNRLKRMMFKAVWTISQHISNGGFEPTDHEVLFENYGKYPPITLDMPSGEKISLRGRIDRVDMYENEEGVYVRIIDYKSGNKEFDLSDIYNGLEFQLLIYLDAILNYLSKSVRKPIFPGGILYFRINDPIVSTKGELSQEEIEREIMKAFKMKGLLLSDVKVIREMDRGIDNHSIVIPAMIKKDGTLGSASSAASPQEFEALRKYVKDKIIDLCKNMLDGNIDISPYRSGSKTACEYCSFRAVCRFDPSLKENSYRKIKRYSDDEIWSFVKEKYNEKGGVS